MSLNSRMGNLRLIVDRKNGARSLLKHVRVKGTLWGKSRRCPAMPPLQLIRAGCSEPLTLWGNPLPGSHSSPVG